jgi:hypothetical protein
MKLTHVALLLVSAAVSVAQAAPLPSSTEGFAVAQPMSLIPVTVCAPGERPEYAAGSWKCPEGHPTISPEQYVQQQCPGASLSSYNLSGGGSYISVVMRFKLPDSKCPAQAQ